VFRPWQRLLPGRLHVAGRCPRTSGVVVDGVGALGTHKTFRIRVARKLHQVRQRVTFAATARRLSEFAQPLACTLSDCRPFYGGSGGACCRLTCSQATPFGPFGAARNRAPIRLAHRFDTERLP
jgi:hypothetical protein